MEPPVVIGLEAHVVLSLDLPKGFRMARHDRPLATGVSRRWRSATATSSASTSTNLGDGEPLELKNLNSFEHLREPLASETSERGEVIHAGHLRREPRGRLRAGATGRTLAGMLDRPSGAEEKGARSDDGGGSDA